MRSPTSWLRGATFSQTAGATGMLLALFVPAGTYAQKTCQPVSDPPVAAVFAAEAVSDDVVADVAWSAERELPPVARIVIRDPFCEIVGEEVVYPEPGGVTETMVADALAQASEYGLKYQIAAEDLAGQALAEPFHVQVALDCPTAEVCSYDLVNGVFSDGIFLGEELDQALDKVASAAPDDVLGQVIEQFPHLRGEVYAFAAQLSNLDKRTGFWRPEDCACVWTTPYTQTPDQVAVHQSGENSELRVVAGFSNVKLYLGAKTVAETVKASQRSEAALGLKLRCQVIGSWVPLGVEITEAKQTRPTLELRLPVFNSCEILCSGRVTHDVDLQLEMSVLAEGGNSLGAQATADEIVDYSVDATPVISSQPGVAAVAEKLRGRRSDDVIVVKTATTPAAQPSRALLVMDGAVSVSTSDGDPPLKIGGGQWQPGDGGKPLAFADLINFYEMSARGESECAVVRTVTLEIQDTFATDDTDGGLRIDRTRP